MSDQEKALIVGTGEGLSASLARLFAPARGDTFMHPLVNFRSKPHGAVGTECYPSGKISLFFHPPEMGSAVWNARKYVR